MLAGSRILQAPRRTCAGGCSHGTQFALRGPARCTVRVRVSEKEAEEAASDSVESGLAAIAKQILQTDPEARESLRRYEEAVVRLEKAKAASEELDRMFAEAQKGAVITDEQQEQAQRQRANEVMADAEVAAAERLLAAAELEFAAAQAQQQEWAAAANDGPERIESVKAATVAATAGLLAELPLTMLTAGGDTPALSSALTLLSAVAACFLFGVTYRYAVRSDSSNRQLRLGVVAAFGLVRASGAADVLQASSAGSDDGPLSLAGAVGPGALYALESLILFGFASVAVEAAFNAGFLKRFGERPQQ
ncbi:hypothetical protein HXX76_005855 [Chlamydomonas incerta]|uniref:Uncharacterized protein n=1 Tax=Chlamydomonas incerta TaxID=51695 RepID=A0A835T4F4_CHLIN|nr:hypothetical protein HXX76_005855 [Chlamydomonas incerta]|eukprot:KAG2437191.1 hypothetical protein HXX76_005855 [Chlamydomonas incerta]